ncbi:HAD-IA family hydrolase [Acidicapsa acidisoli]|uniref:HAD-IA family hydrolase n=1 Tax=Acidicapsa acidisoli TaxID=1615681 RepID=UPI0021E074FC|nr:HAD-IA family hydrolase [Acidicapsa acidisoli]
MSSSLSVSGNEFEVVLFDVGGVLLTNGWDHVERATVLDQFQLDRAAFEARHPDPYDALERDTITMQDYLNATIFYEPRPFTPDDFIASMKVQSKPIHSNALGVLGEIAASDSWLVGLLNNESRLLHEYRMEKFGIEKHLDIQLSSCYLGLRKPDADIYRRALDILGRPADRVLFIDDRKGNADAAAAAGIHAIQFLGEEQLRRDLKQVGIL